MGERTKHGSKGGRAAAAKGDWLRNMAPVAKTRYIRDANLKALYGMSLAQYEQLLAMQAGGGRVRGLLCGNFNRALGLLEAGSEPIRQG
jgi:hypothetical protein